MAKQQYSALEFLTQSIDKSSIEQIFTDIKKVTGAAMDDLNKELNGLYLDTDMVNNLVKQFSTNMKAFERRAAKYKVDLFTEMFSSDKSDEAINKAFETFNIRMKALNKLVNDDKLGMALQGLDPKDLERIISLQETIIRKNYEMYARDSAERKNEYKIWQQAGIELEEVLKSLNIDRNFEKTFSKFNEALKETDEELNALKKKMNDFNFDENILPTQADQKKFLAWFKEYERQMIASGKTVEKVYQDIYNQIFANASSYGANSTFLDDIKNFVKNYDTLKLTYDNRKNIKEPDPWDVRENDINAQSSNNKSKTNIDNQVEVNAQTKKHLDLLYKETEAYKTLTDAQKRYYDIQDKDKAFVKAKEAILALKNLNGPERLFISDKNKHLFQEIFSSIQVYKNLGGSIADLENDVEIKQNRLTNVLNRARNGSLGDTKFGFKNLVEEIAQLPNLINQVNQELEEMRINAQAAAGTLDSTDIDTNLNERQINSDKSSDSTSILEETRQEAQSAEQAVESLDKAIDKLDNNINTSNLNDVNIQEPTTDGHKVSLIPDDTNFKQLADELLLKPENQISAKVDLVPLSESADLNQKSDVLLDSVVETEKEILLVPEFKEEDWITSIDKLIDSISTKIKRLPIKPDTKVFKDELDQFVKELKQITINIKTNIVDDDFAIYDNLADTLIDRYHISDEQVQNQIKDLTRQIYNSKYNEILTGQVPNNGMDLLLENMDNLGKLIVQNGEIANQYTGTYKELFEYIYKYRKIKISPDDLKDIDKDAWEELRKAFPGKFVTDQWKDGTGLDKFYQDAMSSLPQGMLDNLSAASDQLQEILTKVRFERNEKLTQWVKGQLNADDIGEELYNDLLRVTTLIEDKINRTANHVRSDMGFKSSFTEEESAIKSSIDNETIYLNSLNEKVKEVTSSIDLKTQAIYKEEMQMRSSADKEVKALKVIGEQVDLIKNNFDKPVDLQINTNAEKLFTEETTQTELSSIRKIKNEVGLLKNKIDEKTEAIKREDTQMFNSSLHEIEAVQGIITEVQKLSELLKNLPGLDIDAEKIFKAIKELQEKQASSNDIKLEKDSEEWKRAAELASKYNIELGETLDITRKIRTDSKGNTNVSYLVEDTKGNKLTFGANGKLLNSSDSVQKDASEAINHTNQLLKEQEQALRQVVRYNKEIAKLDPDTNAKEISLLEQERKKYIEICKSKTEELRLSQDLYDVELNREKLRRIASEGDTAVKRIQAKKEDKSINDPIDEVNRKHDSRQRELEKTFSNPPKQQDDQIDSISKIKQEERVNKLYKEQNELYTQANILQEKLADANLSEKERNQLLLLQNTIYEKLIDNQKRFAAERDAEYKKTPAVQAKLEDMENIFKNFGWGETLDVSKIDFTQLQTKFAESGEKGLKKLIDDLNKAQNKLNDLKLKGKTDYFGEVFAETANDVEKLIEKLLKGEIELTDFNSKINDLYKNASQHTRTIGIINNPQDVVALRSQLEQMALEMANGRKVTTQWDAELRELTATFTNLDNQVRNVKLSVKGMLDDTQGAAQATFYKPFQQKTPIEKFLDGLKGKLGDLARYMMTFVGFQEFLQMIRTGAGYVKQLDDAMTELRKVSDDTESALISFSHEAYNIAHAVGATGKEIVNSAADWQRLGYSIKEASELARQSNIYANVGDMDVDTATEHMISSVKAWESEFTNEVEAATAIVDRYNEIGKNCRLV